MNERLSGARHVLQMLLLTAAVLAANYARTAVGPLQEAMRSALSLSDNQIALLQGPALALPAVVAAIPLGFLIDRYSRVRLLFVLTVLSMAGSIFTAIASTFTLLFLARCLVGFTATAAFTVALSLVADLYAPDQRGRATTMVAISQIVGMSAAFAIGGALLAVFGVGHNGWRWAMFWLASPLLLVAVLVLAMREPARNRVDAESPSRRGAFAELWQYRAVIAPLLSGMVMVEMSLGAAMIWAAPMLSRSFDLPPDRVGVIMASGLIVSGVLGPVVGGTLADFCQRSGGPRRTMGVVSGLALLGVPTVMFAFVPGFLSASALLLMFMTIVSATCVMGTTLFTVAIPNELRGLCMAVMMAACILFAVGLAPVVVSLLSGAFGGPATISTALAVVGAMSNILGAAAFALARRYFRVHERSGPRAECRSLSCPQPR